MHDWHITQIMYTLACTTVLYISMFHAHRFPLIIYSDCTPGCGLSVSTAVALSVSSEWC